MSKRFEMVPDLLDPEGLRHQGDAGVIRHQVHDGLIRPASGNHYGQGGPQGAQAWQSSLAAEHGHVHVQEYHFPTH